MILYTENHKDSIRKLLELISEFSKISGTKSVHNHHLHFYIITMKNQKNKESIPIMIETKRIKYLGINLTKETKNCTEKIIRH